MAHLVEIIKHDETKMQENLFPIATNNKRERERERERPNHPRPICPNCSWHVSTDHCHRLQSSSKLSKQTHPKTDE